MAKRLTLAECASREQLAKLFAAHVGDLARDCRRVDVFRDFLSLSAISICNAFLRSPKLEEEYTRIMARHGEKEQVEKGYAYLLAITVEALERDCSDFLGHVYMSQEMGVTEAGQFFTPASVARALVQCTMGDLQEQLAARDYVTVNDPACGGGVMLIEAVSEFRRQGLNPSRQICVYGEDIDITCVHMAYVQLALLGVPAIMSHRNTISMETWSQWRTPVWWLNGFEWRERRRQAGECSTPITETRAAGDDGAAAPIKTEPSSPAPECRPGREAAPSFDVDLSQAKQADLFAM